MLVIGMAMSLTACTSDDPSKGGFFGGLIGLGSGAYEGRVDAEKAELEAEEVRYQGEVDGRNRLDRSLTERRAQAAELGDRLASLREDVDGLDAEITALQEEENVTVEQVEQAEADVATLLDDIDRIEQERAVADEARALGADAGPDVDPAEFGEPPREQISDLRTYIDKLQAAVDALKQVRDGRSIEAGAGTVETSGR